MWDFCFKNSIVEEKAMIEDDTVSFDRHRRIEYGNMYNVLN